MPLSTMIRDGTAEDARLLARIHMDARAIAMPWLAVVHSERETEEWMAEIVLASQRVRVAVLDGGALVGFTAWINGWLEQLYVRPGYQGRGVGSSLFQDTSHPRPRRSGFGCSSEMRRRAVSTNVAGAGSLR